MNKIWQGMKDWFSVPVERRVSKIRRYKNGDKYFISIGLTRMMDDFHTWDYIIEIVPDFTNQKTKFIGQAKYRKVSTRDGEPYRGMEMIAQEDWEDLFVKHTEDENE